VKQYPKKAVGGGIRRVDDPAGRVGFTAICSSRNIGSMVQDVKRAMPVMR